MIDFPYENVCLGNKWESLKRPSDLLHKLDVAGSSPVARSS